MFDTPKFFRRDGAWFPIDSTLVPGEAAGTFRNTANDWSVVFAPLDEGGVTVTAAGGESLSFTPEGGRAARPEVGKDDEANTVLYRAVWPGVDLRYTVFADRVKEDIVLHGPDRRSFAFTVAGDDLIADAEVPGAMAVADRDGTRDGGLRLNPVEVFDKRGAPLGPEIAGGGMTVRSVDVGDVVAGKPADQRLDVSVSQSWLSSLKPADFPVVVDPTVVVGGGSDEWFSYKSDGYVCGSSGAWCASRVGNSRSGPGGADTFWRSVLHFNYEQFQQAGTGQRVTNAKLHLYQSAGTANPTTAIARWATNFGFSQGEWWTSNAPPYAPWVEDWDHFYDYSWLDVTELFDEWFRSGGQGGRILLKGDETSGLYTYKEYGVLLDLTVEKPPPTPAYVGPADGLNVIAGALPTLRASVPSWTDGDGQAVQLRFLLATGADGQSGTVADSWWLPQGTAQWQIPDGVLREGQTYYWKVLSKDSFGWGDLYFAQVSTPLPARSLKVVRRHAAGSASPTDSLSGVTANLVTGNASLSIPSGSVGGVGGSFGATFTFDSIQDRQGLEGSYYRDDQGSSANPPNGVLEPNLDTLLLKRTDPQVSFNWSTGTPSPALPLDHFMVQWNGFISLPDDPAVAGVDQWQLGYQSDDGIKIFVDDVLAVSSWQGQGLQPAPVFGGPTYAGGVAPRQFRVEYWESVWTAEVHLFAKRSADGKVVAIPSDWLSVEAKVLPTGWTLGTDGVDAELVRARVGDSAVTLYEPDGTAWEYKKSATGVYTPPAGFDDIVVVNDNGSVTVTATDGRTYTFRSDGQLQSITSSEDDRKPATATYTYDTLGRPTAMVDPVSQRQVTLTYQDQGGCPAAPAAIAAQVAATPPPGMLCKVGLWDGTHTGVYYNSNQPSGQVIWVVNRLPATEPEYWGVGYDTANRITAILDPLAVDAALAGVRTDPNVLTTLAYQTSANRVNSIDAPDPHAGVAGPVHTFGYPTVNPNVDFTGGTSTVTVAGITGVSRTVTYDAQGRLTVDTDALNRSTTYGYKANTNLVTSVTAPDGLITTTTYDHADRPITVSVPHPAAEANPPITTTGYDEATVDAAFASLGATWWTNGTLTGAPKTYGTGISAPGGIISQQWQLAPNGLPAEIAAVGGVKGNWGLRLSGEIAFPTNGTWTMRIWSRGGMRLVIDDTVTAINDWTDPGGNTARFQDTTFNVTGAAPGVPERHRIRVDYRETAGEASLDFFWLAPGGSWANVPGLVNPSNGGLSPRYGLTTSTTDPTGKRVETRYSNGNGIGPHHGLATAVVTDPAGLALTETTAYETPGSGYLRRTSRTLPGGNATTYEYYGDTETRSNPCTGGALVNQGGMLKRSTSPAAADGAVIKREQVYDAAGRVVANATFTAASPAAGDWICTTYDARGRVSSVAYPAYGGQPARTVTYNYKVNNSPVALSVTDTGLPAGNQTIAWVIDLLGRTWMYVDVWAKVTYTTYDQAGRLTHTTPGVGSAVQRVYDTASRVTEVKLGGSTIANGFVYDNANRLREVVYPSGAGTVGNSTKGTSDIDPNRGWVTGITWRTIGGTLITSDTVSRDNAGDITGQVIDGVEHHAGQDYLYDNTGRLIDAYVPGRRYQYAFAASNPCGVNSAAGKNTNRTTETVTIGAGSPVSTGYCYDNSDRLTSATDPTVGSIVYDSHGNTTSIYGEVHGYDAADRHMTTSKSGATVSYLRDANDRIVQRTLNSVVTARYSYAAVGDTPDVTLDAANNTLESTYSLPGGVLVTTRPVGNVWSYPNAHGDVSATANQAGTKQGATLVYDPYGKPLVAIPDNSAANLDYGWLGQHQRSLEHELALQPIIEMGARQYSSSLGRFLQVDPIEGGSCNDYDYVCGDPLNKADLTGEQQPPQLSPEERDAIMRRQEGLPYDKRVYRRAIRKKQAQEKYARERNRQKNRDQTRRRNQSNYSIPDGLRYGIGLGAIGIAVAASGIGGGGARFRMI